MIEKMNQHYSFTNPASIHDEEALTALELAGRQGAKINEIIDSQNTLTTETKAHLSEQDGSIKNAINAIPGKVTDEVQKQIDNGTVKTMVDASVSTKTADLTQRVDNLVGSVSAGSTSLDAEVIDIRAGADGKTYASAGEAVRTQLGSVFQIISTPVVDNPYVIAPEIYKGNFTCVANHGVVTFSGTPDTNMTYMGFSVRTPYTMAQMAGKTVIVIIHEMTHFADCVLKVQTMAGDWTNSINRPGYFNDFSKVVRFTVPETETRTDRCYIGFDLSSAIKKFNAINMSVSVYLIDEKIGTPLATHALNLVEVPEIKHSKNAGYKTLNPNGNWCGYLAHNNKGSYNIDGEVFTVDVGEITSDGSVYTAASIRCENTLKGVKGIFIEKSPTITNICLTKTDCSWQYTIRNLKAGYNDISDIPLEEYEKIYFTIGIYGATEPQTGYVNVYLIEDNKVFASHVVNGQNYCTADDVIRIVNSNSGFANYITVWGDSLTAQGGWTDRLATLTGMTVKNCGTGGENSDTITARQGGDCMMINNIIIPADKTPVTLATYSDGGIPTYFGNKCKPLMQGGSEHVNPVCLGNVWGTLAWTGSSYNDASGAWTFTRNYDGEVVAINRPTCMTTQADRNNNGGRAMIIFMGQNDVTLDIDALVLNHRRMIDHSNANKTIVLGLSSGTASSRSAYENRMKQEFGRYFISLRDYLSKYGLSDAGLSPTSDDTTAMNEGRVPPQLLKDTIHYTDACKTVIGNMLYRKLIELNIISI